MNVLNQDELDALFDSVSEDEPDETGGPAGAGTSASAAPASGKGAITWTQVRLAPVARSANILAAEQYEASKGETAKISTIETDSYRIKSSPGREVGKRLKKEIPFLELLSDFGGGKLEKGKQVRLATGNGNIEGSFKGFFFDEKDYEGGIVVETGEGEAPVGAQDILIGENGTFNITVL